MNLFLRFAAAVLFCTDLQSKAFTQGFEPPFSIELEEVTWPGWPGLQSFAIGEWEGRWIVASGRTGGLHGFLPPNPFTVTEANRFIFLFDPTTGEQWNADVFTLPGDIASQLRSTNTEYVQRDKYLYIAGGYGKDTITDQFITFPSLLAIDLELLTAALMSGGDISPSIRKMEDTLFQVTGGEIELLNDQVYLFGGHIFTGEYTKPATPLFTQEYTNALKKFKLDDDGETITISDIEIIKDTSAFHRRDLNFEPILFPGEEFGLAAFSGVFQYEADWVWFNPVYFMDDTYFVDETFSQQLNHYTCPVMTLYDSVTENYYATFFGGIGQYYYNEDDDTIKQDLNVPFVNDISTVVKYADGTTEQVPMPLSFDALLGSNMVFVLNDEAPHYANDVIRLHNVEGDLFAGYLFGGIDALIPNFTPSTASNRLFKVKIHHEQPLGVLIQPASGMIIFPNPADDGFTVQNKTTDQITDFRLVNELGQVVLYKNTIILPGLSYTIDRGELSPGIYFLMMKQAEEIIINKVILE